MLVGALAPATRHGHRVSGIENRESNTMSGADELREMPAPSLRKKTVALAIGVAIGVAAVSFTVVALLPPPKGPFFEAPLRSFLTGLGVLAVACPPLIAGRLLKKRAEASPYYEEGFIRAVFNIVGFVCFVVGATCVGLSVWALLKRLLDL